MADEMTTTKSKSSKSSLPDGVREVTILVGDNVDDATVEEAIRSLAPSVAGIVGNYADVQRAGAAIVTGTGNSFADGVVPPPDADAVAAAEVSAAVEKAVEDSRTGNPSSVGDSHTGAAIRGGTYNPPSAK
jgi:hypothetical protein